MSVELFAYSNDPLPVAIGHLAAACKARGYECRVIRADSTPVSEGVLESEDAIVGWSRTFFGNRAARDAAKSADCEALGKLQERQEIGVCVVEVWDKPEKYNDADELRELEDVYGLEYVEYRKNSCVRWYIRLAAGRNDLSVEFANAVLRALLDLRGGLFENPQSGEFGIVRRIDGVA